MSLEQLASIASIVEAVAVIASVILILREVRETTRITTAAKAQSLVEMAAPFNLALIENREMARLWVEGAQNYDQMDAVEQFRYRSLLVWWLLLHENIFYQHENGLLDDASYAAWENDLSDFIRDQQLHKFWPQLSSNLQKGFGDHVERLINRPSHAA